MAFWRTKYAKALSHSNNNLAVTAEETRLRIPVMSSRGRGRGGFTPTQPFRLGLMYDSQTSQTSQTRPPVVSQSVDTHRDQIRDQFPPVLNKLVDSLSDLKNTMRTLTSGSTAHESQARDAGKRLPISGRKFEPLDEY